MLMQHCGNVGLTFWTHLQGPLYAIQPTSDFI